MSTIVCKSRLSIIIARCSNNYYLYYNQTPLLRTPLGLEQVSVLQSVLIKRVNLKENVWGGTKKTVHNNENFRAVNSPG